MYNEEKKLITDIQRKKDLDRNLALFAGWHRKQIMNMHATNSP